MAQAPSWNLVGLPACSLISQIACNLPILSRYVPRNSPSLPILPHPRPPTPYAPLSCHRYLGSRSHSRISDHEEFRDIESFFFQGGTKEGSVSNLGNYSVNSSLVIRLIIQTVVWTQFVPLISLHFAIYFHGLRAWRITENGLFERIPLPSPPVMHVNLPSCARVPFVPVCVGAKGWNLRGEIAIARHGGGGGEKEEVDSNRFDLIVLAFSVSVSRARRNIPRSPDNLTFKLRSW